MTASHKTGHQPRGGYQPGRLHLAFLWIFGEEGNSMADIVIDSKLLCYVRG